MNLFCLVVKHTVAISLEVGVGDLLAELAADALVILASLEAAGAVAALLLKPLLYHSDNLGIVVESYVFHKDLPYKSGAKSLMPLRNIHSISVRRDLRLSISSHFEIVFSNSSRATSTVGVRYIHTPSSKW